MIEVAGLNVRFGYGRSRVHAVRNCSFSVGVGESFGLVGESGSGKSTVLRALSGLYRNWTGTITIDGEACGNRRNRAFYKKLQMVFQDPYGSLHPRHTINQILAEPLEIHRFDAIEDRVVAALGQVGLSTEYYYRYPHQLSGGQRQRVAIARAMILEPRVLLLDEPTSALDVSIQAEVLNLLQQIKETYQLTFIVVSHDLAVIAHMCEELAVMKQGEIIENLTIDSLRREAATEPYTRQLIQSSKGYDRETARALIDFD